MDINEVYKFLQFLSNKDQRGRLTPSDFNLAISRAQNEWVMKTYKNLNQTRPTEKGWQRNQKVTDDLRFLLVEDQVALVDSNGVLSLPSDYLHLSTIRFKRSYLEDGQMKTDIKSADIVNDGEIGSYLSSNIFKKKIDSKKFAIAAIYSDHIKIYPNDIQRVDLTYLRVPTTPKWAFTLSQTNKPVYDPVNSVDLDVPEDVFNEIIAMACSYLSINLREPALTQYSEMLKQEGV